MSGTNLNGTLIYRLGLINQLNELCYDVPNDTFIKSHGVQIIRFFKPNMVPINNF